MSQRSLVDTFRRLRVRAAQPGAEGSIARVKLTTFLARYPEFGNNVDEDSEDVASFRAKDAVDALLVGRVGYYLGCEVTRNPRDNKGYVIGPRWAIRRAMPVFIAFMRRELQQRLAHLKLPPEAYTVVSRVDARIGYARGFLAGALPYSTHVTARAQAAAASEGEALRAAQVAASPEAPASLETFASSDAPAGGSKATSVEADGTPARLVDQSPAGNLEMPSSAELIDYIMHEGYADGKTLQPRYLLVQPEGVSSQPHPKRRR